MTTDPSTDWNHPGARWWKFDFHTHTPASVDYGKGDYQSSLKQLAPSEWLLAFMRAGVDCVAVTDHNTGELFDLLRRELDDLESSSHPEFRPLYQFPGIELSAYGREEVVDRAFEMGAVDYVVKPFSPTELTARIKSALRRRVTVEPSEPYVLGDLTIDYGKRRVSLAGRRVQPAPTEYGMLAELSAHAGRVLTHEHLLERDWAGRSKDNVRPMHTMVSKLRRKLGEDA